MRRRILLLGLLALLSTACVHGRHKAHPHGGPPGQADKAAVHVHTNDCIHVWVDGVWVTRSSRPGHAAKPGRGRKK